ncbi:MAG: DNA-directed RNA polymerase subunit omega [Wolbachia sp.]|nr:DNA-directed RNA polymerase subunit omega [Wolbachia sp.]MDD9336264.1 DNA-directed RNA polymerase subunit omega [Wolbachia sp.]
MVEFIVERCVEQISNRFKLTLLASQRTHDLNTGASNPTQVVKFKNYKNTMVSLYEIAERKVDLNELFSLLVGRCKEYMKGNVSSAHSSSEDKLRKLLNFSSDQFHVNQESTDQYSTGIDIENDGE